VLANDEKKPGSEPVSFAFIERELGIFVFSQQIGRECVAARERHNFDSSLMSSFVRKRT
jgi:hypothetical protein